jgi:chromosome partitioning protein
MGLFNRGARTRHDDLPFDDEPWGSNGGGAIHEAENGAVEPPEPAEPELEEASELEAALEPHGEVDADDTGSDEDTASEVDDDWGFDDPAEEVEAAVAEPESEPVIAVRRGEDDVEDGGDDDEGRMTPEQVLTPARGPAPRDEAGPGEARAKVYVFANQKGGVAKTTTTLNLAVAFKETGHRVLAIDLDPQGNLTMSQGIDPDKAEKSMYDVLVQRTPISQVIQQREIDIAVASIDLAGAEIAMSTMIGRERSLEKALSEVISDYDFVCIDTPPSLGLLTVNALTAADKVIVPVQCEYLSMRGLVQLQNTLEMIRENLNPRVEIEGILPTMLDARTVHAKEAVEILEENFGELVFKSRIRKAIKFAEAPVRGSSVLKYDPKGNAAEYYRDLAREVLTHGAS